MPVCRNIDATAATSVAIAGDTLVGGGADERVIAAAAAVGLYDFSAIALRSFRTLRWHRRHNSIQLALGSPDDHHHHPNYLRSCHNFRQRHQHHLHLRLLPGSHSR